MRILPVCGLFLAIAAAPALAQSGPNPSDKTTAPAAAAAAPGGTDYAALTQKLQARNKELVDQVNAQKAMVKHNEELLKEAQHLDAANKKLETERQQLEAQNANLQKQREALNSAQATQTASAGPGAH